MSDSDGLSGNEFSEDRYLALYKDLRRRYEALHERLDLRLGWYELTDIIFTEDGVTPPMDLLQTVLPSDEGADDEESAEQTTTGEAEASKRVVTPWEHGSSLTKPQSPPQPQSAATSEPPDADFRELLDVLMLAWNNLPHELLDHQSPAEVHAAEQRRNAYTHDNQRTRAWLAPMELMADPTSFGFATDVFPQVRPYQIMGISRTDVSKFAKDLAQGRKPGYAAMRDELLHDLPHFYFEENALHAMLIGKVAKTPAEAFALLDEFLPHLKDRKTADTPRVPAFKQDLTATFDKLRGWIASDNPYAVRFVMVTLMRDFTGTDFNVEQAELVAGVKPREIFAQFDGVYNVMLAQEWYFSTVLIDHLDAVAPLFERRVLPRDIHNNALRRAIRSKRVSAEQREKLRELIIDSRSGARASRD